MTQRSDNPADPLKRALAALLCYLLLEFLSISAAHGETSARPDGYDAGACIHGYREYLAGWYDPLGEMDTAARWKMRMKDVAFRGILEGIVAGQRDVPQDHTFSFDPATSFHLRIDSYGLRFERFYQQEIAKKGNSDLKRVEWSEVCPSTLY